MSIRTRLRPLAAGALAALVLAGLAACGDDDGDAVREIGDGCASASASGGSASGGASASGGSSASGCGSASASGSASGIQASDIDVEVDNQLIIDAVDDYRDYVAGQIDEMITATKAFTDAVRAGDVEEAKSLFAVSRTPWERIEPIAGLIEEIDGAVDARVDDFADEDDPEWTGWHKLEYLLWEEGDVSGAAELADKLDEDLATLKAEFADLELPPAALAVGATELIQEVSEGKITGEEDRYSHTDLWDFQANVEGSEVLVDALRPALEEADADLLADIDEGFEELYDALDEHRSGDGFVLYTELSEADIDALTARLASLSEDMALIAGTLGLE
ncbi:MAG: iron uptake system protein EfeO [Acidimicrobiia bacterium]